MKNKDARSRGGVKWSDRRRLAQACEANVCAGPEGDRAESGFALNLCSLSAFHWVEMLVVAEREQLPVAEARAGDPAAWDALFRRFQLPLFAYVRELVHDEQASLDVVQETFINAARYIRSLRQDDRFGGWLFGIAHQKCIQRWRSQSREETLLEEAGADPVEFEAGPDALLLRQEQEEQFMNLLNALPAPQRAVLLLHFVEDFSIEEIARITGAPPGTVKSRLHYGKSALKKLIEEKSG
jgi:RNA polymerase sigma-70 factor, ECF subfamily